MKLIDADALQTALVNEYIGIIGYRAREVFCRAIEIVRRQPTINPPPNDPLTLEELREMDGEPVWVISLGGQSEPCWMLVDAEYELCREAHGGLAIFDTYGKTCLAYRRKPEKIPYERLD